MQGSIFQTLRAKTSLESGEFRQFEHIMVVPCLLFLFVCPDDRRRQWSETSARALVRVCVFVQTNPTLARCVFVKPVQFFLSFTVHRKLSCAVAFNSEETDQQDGERYEDKGSQKGIRAEERGGGSTALTFFGVTGSILAGVTHHPIRLVPRSVFQHVIPEIHKETGHWWEFTPHPRVEAIRRSKSVGAIKKSAWNHDSTSVWPPQPP